ncbi:hypothetical protein BV361_03795 [Pseudomonas syringae pv. actinidiae]|nr:hypothetical protein BV361_03795 [Pseudomonas syringae pv. actinidiae]
MTVGTGKRMIDAGVQIGFHARGFQRRRKDLGASLCRAELIQLGSVQDQSAPLQALQLAQCLLDTDAVIANGARHLRQAAGGQISQFSAQAITTTP